MALLRVAFGLLGIAVVGAACTFVGESDRLTAPLIEEDKVGDLRAAGADDFMHKPFEIERLLERMCQLLDIEAVSST